MMLLVSWIFVRSTPRKIDGWFRRLQLVSASMYSLGHGGNDAQKTIGIIWMLLIAAGYSGTDNPPTWVIISCYCAISLGTLFGGWRIVKTMGQKITKLKPVGGFARKPVAPSPCSSPLPWVFRYRLRIPLPVPSSVSVLRTRCRPCAGAWPAISCGPGFSPFPLRRSSRQ